MSRPIIPLECLHLIITKIAEEHDTATLARLLQVNRYFCSATLPFLYRDPFLSMSYVYEESAISVDELTWQSTQNLLRLVPSEQCPELLRMMFLEYVPVPDKVDGRNENYGQVWDTSTFGVHSTPRRSKDTYTQPVVDYLSHLRCLEIFSRCSFITDDRLRQAHINHCMETVGPRETLKDDIKHASHRIFFIELDTITIVDAEIRRQLTWTLCNRSTIQVLQIPLSDIRRYLDCVHEFKALYSLNVAVDRDFILPQDGRIQMAMTDKDLEKADERAKMFLAAQEDMVRFVHQHASIHKGVLRAVSTLKFPWASDELNRIPVKTLVRAIKALPPLSNPRTLDNINWLHFIAKAQETNLDSVKFVSYPMGYELVSIERYPPIHRCRAMQSMRLQATTDDVLKWAVEEKKQYEYDIRQGVVPKPLVPLESIDIDFRNETSHTAADDAAYAFSGTLVNLRIEDLYRSGDDYDGPSVAFHFGHRWNLPKLEVLVISSPGNTLHLGSNILGGCKALKEVSLRDSVWDYSPDQIQSWHPAELPCLKGLQLIGTPALSFHPATLQSTASLEVLVMSMPVKDGSNYIPLDNGDTHVEPGSTHTLPQTLWSWDWHLPKLTRLWLGATFAFKFRFQMLQYCPLLEQLQLNISTPETTHTRYLTTSDFTLSLDTSSVEESNSCGTALLHLPALWDFQIKGSWRFQKELLLVLFHEVAPNIERVCMTESTGFHLKDWMDSMEGLKQLVLATCHLTTTMLDLTNAGLTLHVPSAEAHRICHREHQSTSRFTDEERAEGPLFCFESRLCYVRTPVD
ncbi:hypothetical protein BG011_005710 [Mortierella polycephala]|uniref:Uncharacterized protein n=1 Tax=Mortierella polycephala TaxID=41804 RepID=A0A9P6QJA4_9FUNG|nr:hypothetical protein BG011_005710 [Mortierella polycephala]